MILNRYGTVLVVYNNTNTYEVIFFIPDIIEYLIPRRVRNTPTHPSHPPKRKGSREVSTLAEKLERLSSRLSPSTMDDSLSSLKTIEYYF